MLKITKGHNSLKDIGRVYFFFSSHLLIMSYICIKFRKNISKGLRVVMLT